MKKEDIISDLKWLKRALPIVLIGGLGVLPGNILALLTEMLIFKILKIL